MAAKITFAQKKGFKIFTFFPQNFFGHFCGKYQ